ncbi:hypothetical protein F5984_25185 [Rudanella paleaurantiibacter]|uniref:TMF family protein n=1 Tax=Rudanella paleaurantiibacter TaxID=2614655 RepID=A0A7J5TS77_9BACT|nr:hypothetical protein [Rudanella paleaurantiibacter]KAB7725955.1 hypothetical protein F5984_25185 [Rudanella paleaurantiibacter]
MRKYLLVFFLSLTNEPLAAQQISFGGNRVLHITGSSNLFLGINSGNNISVGAGQQNTFIGRNTGLNISTGNNNTFIGAFAGEGNTSANDNTFIGSYVGRNNTGGVNSFLGSYAGWANTTGTSNIFLGASAGLKNQTGSENTMVGTQAGQEGVNGARNTFLGFKAGYGGSATGTGSSNTFVGWTAGINNSTGNLNTLIGYAADVVSNSLTNAAAIGANARVAVSNAIVLGDPTNTSMAVGIGTDSPQFPLDVRGIINLRNRGTIKFSHLSNPNLRHGATDQFLTVNEQGETVMARYRISIGDASQWADKVFAPGYRLRSLAQVEAYTQQHGHLPGVPSAQEVAREGADVAKLTATLLEKIEELTLYTIQLEKNNRQQRAELDELKRAVRKLKK